MSKYKSETNQRGPDSWPKTDPVIHEILKDLFDFSEPADWQSKIRTMYVAALASDYMNGANPAEQSDLFLTYEKLSHLVGRLGAVYT